MRPLYLCYHTGGEYAESAAELESTLKEFSLDYDIIERPSRGHWFLNLNQKPEVIRDAMLENPGTPIVWLDADARVVRKPVLFDFLSCDFAAHWLAKAELLSSTMYWGTSPKAMELINAWCDAAQREPMVMDQRLLQAIVDPDKSIRKYDLPESYACIFDRGKVDETEVVIRQMQLSRKTFWGKLPRKG